MALNLEEVDKTLRGDDLWVKGSARGILITMVLLGFGIPSYALTPTVNFVTPNNGINSSLQNVTIKGTNFSQGAKVSLLNGGPFLVGTYDRGGVSEISVSGNYAYVISGNALDVINITNPTNPFRVGMYVMPERSGGQFSVSGGYAYVLNAEAGLLVVDISNPTNPFLAGTYNVTPYTTNIFISGNYAFVTHVSGLLVIDITDPIKPSQVGSYKTQKNSTSFWGVYVSDKQAYCAGGIDGFFVIDVTDPTNPSLSGSYQWPKDLRSDKYLSTHDVYVSGNLAYVASSFGLVVMDITDSTTPTPTGSYYVQGMNSDGIYFSGNNVYLADRHAGLIVLDVTDSTNPIAKASVELGRARGVFVKDKYAYVAAHDEGLVVIDVTHASPLAVGSIDIGRPYTPGISHGENVFVSGNHAYFASDHLGLVVVDIADPANPSRVATASVRGPAKDVFVLGNNAYVASRDAGLVIMNISDPSNPREVGSYFMAPPSQSVYVLDNYAYVVGGRLFVINISDPTNPSLVGSYDVPWSAEDVFVSGNYAYVANYNEGLHIIDVNDPTNPFQTGVYKNDQFSAEDVYVSGKYAYVAAESGLVVLNISNPTNPTLEGLYDVPTGWGKSFFRAPSAKGIYVSGNRAFVATEYTGLLVIDITDPTIPYLTGSFDTTWSFIESVHVSGSYVYMAEWLHPGLRIIKLNDPVTNITIVDSETITATFPKGAVPGAYDILVTNPEGQSEEGILQNGYIVEQDMSDTTPPSTIMDLSTNIVTAFSIQLTWTAPGDDEDAGTADSYDIRFSESPITPTNWKNASLALGEPVPKPAGTSQSFTLTDLPCNTTFYAAVQTFDDIPNASKLSNIPFATTKSCGSTQPIILSTNPESNAIDVSINVAITATFSEAMDVSTITNSTFTLFSSEGAILGAVTYDERENIATFNPSSNLLNSTLYTAKVSASVGARSGKSMDSDQVWIFTTIPSSPDTDKDGIPDNMDDNPDEPSIGSVMTTTGTGKILLDTSMNTGSFLQGVKTMSVSSPEINQTGIPTDYKFNDGLIYFNVNGVDVGNTIQVILTFPSIFPEGSKYYKVNSNGFFEFSGAVINGNSVTLTLTDGGDGDDDGVANGVIVDPGGVGVPVDKKDDSNGLDDISDGDSSADSGGGGCFIGTMAHEW